MLTLYADSATLDDFLELKSALGPAASFHYLDKQTLEFSLNGQPFMRIICLHSEQMISHLAAAGFTPRQREVLALVAEGQRNKEIGQALGIADKTVEHHLSAIYRALKVQSRAELIRYLAERGWLESQDQGQRNER